MPIYSSPSYAGAPRFGRPQQLRPSAIIPSILTRIGSERARPRATRRATRSSSTALSSHPALPPALSSMTSSSRGIFASTSYPSGLRARTKALAIGTSRSTSTAFASPSPVIASGSYTWGHLDGYVVEARSRQRLLVLCLLQCPGDAPRPHLCRTHHLFG